MPNTGVNLTQRESELIDATQPAAMVDLDADALMELHARVRRARNKYVTLYRRRGAAKVRAKGARGVAAEANERGWAKAEVFEGALARVSRQLAVKAERNARELKQERLARARNQAAGSGTPDAGKTTGKKTGGNQAGPKKAGPKKNGLKKNGPKKNTAEEPEAKKPGAKVGAAKETVPRKTAGRLKFEASTKASGARRQAKRDSR